MNKCTSRNKRRLSLIYLFLLGVLPVITGAFAFGQQQKASANARVKLEGTLRLVGNEPFTSLVLTDMSGQDWYIDPRDAKALRDLQQRQVVIEGILSIQKQTLADGRELPDKKIVSEITVIKK